MTRASSTTTFARMSQTRRTGTGSGYPQWMRTLEEKYQKLHKKITENTNTTKFTNCVGRSVYDNRLSHALSKYRDMTSHRSSAYKSAKESAINEGPGLNSGLTNKAVCTETLQDQYLPKTDTMQFDKNCFKHGDEFNEENRPCSRDRSLINDRGKREIGSARSRLSKQGSTIIIDELDLDNDKENDNAYDDENDDACVDCVNLYVDDKASERSAENHNKDKVLSTRITNHNGFDKIENDGDKSNLDKYNRRNLKTSVSRTSKVTTKSLPAKIHSQGSKLGQKQLLAARSKSANRLTRMFTPMSEEAKHAITETIHEMNTTTSGRVSDRSDIKFVPSRGRTCVKSWVLPKKSSTKIVYDPKPLLESASRCLQEYVNENIDNVFDNVSNRDDGIDSSAESLHEGSGRNESRLPDIRYSSARETGTGRRQSYRIPGIGKYNIAKDDPVFEITPPGFDSRYNDVLPAEERESETPPPDIRQRAIDKCSEWLVKCNK